MKWSLCTGFGWEHTFQKVVPLDLHGFPLDGPSSCNSKLCTKDVEAPKQSHLLFCLIDDTTRTESMLTGMPIREGPLRIKPTTEAVQIGQAEGKILEYHSLCKLADSQLDSKAC